MKKGINNTIKLIITGVIIFGFVWYFVISPMMQFHKNEKIVLDGAKYYYSLNNGELPVGERIKTVSLLKLAHDKYLKESVFIPHTDEMCSLDNSWVKVKHENNDYHYYVYLECGLFKSNIDHEGPKIELNGDSEINVAIGEEYKELGVKSVVDKVDGKMKIEDVEIKGNVDTSKIGTYEVTYTAYDSMRNKTEVIREVSVVKTLSSTVKGLLNGESNFKGNPSNNYIDFSNVEYRIYGLTQNNDVVIIATEDIGFVNYSKLDEWLDYYYGLLTDKSKEMIVKSKFCNDTLSEDQLDKRSCESTTDEKNIYVPSIVEVNNAQSGNDNYIRLRSITWVANKSSDGKAYVTKNMFDGSEYGKTFLPYDVDVNYGVRPMIVIKGDTLIKDGDGTFEKPYLLGDYKKAHGGTLLNERMTGEYVTYKGTVYRIISPQNDGTTKVIATNSIGSIGNRVEAKVISEDGKIIYNPKDKTSAGYFINNSAAEYMDTSLFVKHEIEVPIYKNKIIYNQQVETKKYDVMFSAPDMYEIFSSKPTLLVDSSLHGSYWLKNSSKKASVGAAVYDAGSVVNMKFPSVATFGVRVVGYLNKNTTVVSGSGTVNSPYVIN